MAMLFAAASIEKNQGTVIFVGAVDEEGNAVGIKNIVKKEIEEDIEKDFRLGYEGILMLPKKARFGVYI